MSKNTFEYEGTLTRVDTFTTNKGGKILTLVFFEDGQWPKWIAAKVFGRATEGVSEWTPGTKLRLSGRLSGREYNGKIYPEIVAEAVEVVSQGELPTGTPPAEEDLPPF